MQPSPLLKNRPGADLPLRARLVVEFVDRLIAFLASQAMRSRGFPM